MSDIVYIVYNDDEENLCVHDERCLNYKVDNNSNTVDSYEFVAKYFTDFNKAKACCDYYNLRERKHHEYNKDRYMTYKIAPLEIGDNSDYEYLYKVEEEEQRIDEEKQKAYFEQREYEKYLKLKEKYEGAKSV